MDKLKSRKFWFALIGALVPIAAQLLTDSVELGEALQLSVGIIVAYIWGQAYTDGQSQVTDN